MRIQFGPPGQSGVTQIMGLGETKAAVPATTVVGVAASPKSSYVGITLIKGR